MEDDIIIAGEDKVPDIDSSRDEPKCGSCGSKLRWRLTINCRQERYCPVCEDND